MLRSQVYEQKMAAGDTDAVAAIRRMSPATWQHVNLFGAFDFSDEAFVMDMEALVARYADKTPVHYRLPNATLATGPSPEADSYSFSCVTVRPQKQI